MWFRPNGPARQIVKQPIRNMKYHILLLAVSGLLAACDADVNVPAKEGDKTTIVNPPGEKKVESNTTVVNPPAASEKTTTTTTEKK